MLCKIPFWNFSCFPRATVRRNTQMITWTLIKQMGMYTCFETLVYKKKGGGTLRHIYLPGVHYGCFKSQTKFYILCGWLITSENLTELANVALLISDNCDIIPPDSKKTVRFCIRNQTILWNIHQYLDKNSLIDELNKRDLCQFSQFYCIFLFTTLALEVKLKYM